MSGLNKVGSVGTVIGAGMAALGKTMQVGSDRKSLSPGNAALRHPGGDEQTHRGTPKRLNPNLRQKRLNPNEAKAIKSKS